MNEVNESLDCFDLIFCVIITFILAQVSIVLFCCCLLYFYFYCFVFLPWVKIQRNCPLSGNNIAAGVEFHSGFFNLHLTTYKNIRPAENNLVTLTCLYLPYRSSSSSSRSSSRRSRNRRGLVE